MELADCIGSNGAAAAADGDQRDPGDVVFGSGLKHVPGMVGGITLIS